MSLLALVRGADLRSSAQTHARPAGIPERLRHSLDQQVSRGASLCARHAQYGNYAVNYAAGRIDTGAFGGNSNWRGPIWFPINFLLVEALQKYHQFYGDDFLVECPTGSGNRMTLAQVSEELAQRLTRIFLRDEQGHRAVFGGNRPFRTTRTGATTSRSTSTSMAISGAASAPATRRAGRPWSPICSRLNINRPPALGRDKRWMREGWGPCGCHPRHTMWRDAITQTNRARTRTGSRPPVQTGWVDYQIRA